MIPPIETDADNNTSLKPTTISLQTNHRHHYWQQQHKTTCAPCTVRRPRLGRRTLGTVAFTTILHVWMCQTSRSHALAMAIMNFMTLTINNRWEEFEFECVWPHLRTQIRGGRAHEQLVESKTVTRAPYRHASNRPIWLDDPQRSAVRFTVL